MSTPSRAMRRSRRTGAHLTLVSAQAADSDPPLVAEEGSPPTPGEQAGQERKLPSAASGSATVRALVALGAIATAIGLSWFGKSPTALLGSHPHRTTPVPEADPGESNEAPEDSPSAPSINKRPSAAHWTPGPAPMVPVAYTLPASAGRHRKLAAIEGWGEWNPDTWLRPTGRHRRVVDVPALATLDASQQKESRTLARRPRGAPERGRVRPRQTAWL